MANNVTSKDFIDIVFDVIKAKTQGKKDVYVNAADIFDDVNKEAPRGDIAERMREIETALIQLHKFRSLIAPQDEREVSYSSGKFRIKEKKDA